MNARYMAAFAAGDIDLCAAMAREHRARVLRIECQQAHAAKDREGFLRALEELTSLIAL